MGQIFNRHPETFYLYEPLHTLVAFVKVNHTAKSDYNENVTGFLVNAYNCRFHQLQDYLTFISHPGLPSSHFRFSSRALSSPPLCDVAKSSTHARQFDGLPVCPPLKSKETSQVCASKRHVVVKILSHRLPRSSLLELIVSERSLRVLYLARDPRAVAWSLLKMNTKPAGNDTTSFTGGAFGQRIGETCAQVLQDLSTAQIIRRFLNKEDDYKILRFEDLATNPTGVAKEIFEFAELGSVPSEVAKWIRENTNATKRDQRDSYSTTGKNATSVRNAWKNSLTPDQLITVEKQCYAVMNKLGYQLSRPG